MAFVKLFLVLIFSLLAAMSCKPVSAPQNSKSQSGYLGEDCSSIGEDLSFQSNLLASVETKMRSLNPPLAPDSLNSAADCEQYNTPGDDRDLDHYHACLRYINLAGAKKARQSAQVAKNCSQNGLKMETVFAAYCDVPCHFGDASCGVAQLYLNGGKQHSFVCGTRDSAKEAAESFCKVIGIDNCTNITTELKNGNLIASQMGSSMAGSRSESENIAVSTSVEISASADITAIAAFSASTSQNAGFGNSIEFKVANGSYPIFLCLQSRGLCLNDEDLVFAPGATAECGLSFSENMCASAKLFVGLGGGLEILGNGIKVKTGIGTSAKLDLSSKKSITLGGKMPVGGLQPQTVRAQCDHFVKRWYTLEMKSGLNNVVNLINAVRSDIMSKKIPETSLDVSRDEIYCTTNEGTGVPFSQGTKVLKVNEVFLSANGGALDIRVKVKGSLNVVDWESKVPFNKNMTFESQAPASDENCQNLSDKSKCVKTNNVGTVISKLADQKELTGDDIRTLLEDVVYNGSYKFLSCDRTSY